MKKQLFKTKKKVAKKAIIKTKKPILNNTDSTITETLKKESISLYHKWYNKCFIINYCCETRDLSKRLSQQRIEYQQELAQKDQTITNIQNAHEEFLNTQLHFYKLAKPQLFQQFEVSNPPALEIGHFLNFLESQWQNKEQQIKQVKQHLTQWITLITNRY